MRPDTRLSWIVSLYVISLFLPAIGTEWDAARGNWCPGFACLISVPVVCFFPAWWANPVLFVGCFLLARRRTLGVRWCGLLASALAASFLLMGWGEPSMIRVGYVFWLASMVLLAVAGFDRAGRSFKPAKVAALEDL